MRSSLVEIEKDLKTEEGCIKMLKTIKAEGGRVYYRKESKRLVINPSRKGSYRFLLGMGTSPSVAKRITERLGIKNEDGVVENLPASMEDAKLKSAIEMLLAKYPPETVAVYLNAFNDMNEANWANLKTLLESVPRLQLGGHG